VKTDLCMEQALLDALSNPRYEVVPVSSVHEEVRSLPGSAQVTITCSPKMGIEQTVVVAEELAAAGFRPVPHLAARQIRDCAHLSEITKRLDAAGVNDVMVLGGDRSAPAGIYQSSLDLLLAMRDLGVSFPQVGVAGYPEGHPFLPQSDLIQTLQAKTSFATYIVTQMCFTAEPIRHWVSEIRSHGVELPVYVGVPGRVSQKRLMTMAARVGVGDSLRFLRRNPASLIRMMLSYEYDPWPLIRDLIPLLSAECGIAGFHVYTFNAIGLTERWRVETLSRLT
jgi:methylenetetrahydrofolate reductase (NADPH)